MEKKKVLEILSQVYDPDYRDRSIIDLGLVCEDDIKIDGERIEVTVSRRPYARSGPPSAL